MKNDKIILITAVVVIASLSLVLNFSFMVKGEPENKLISGYIILMDQEPLVKYGIQGKNEFKSIVYLPSEYVEGSVTSCSFVFPDGVNLEADLSEDGRIDYVDIKLLIEAFGCSKTKACWEQSLKLIDCYFHHSEQRFKDPTRDCYINQTDIDLVKEYSGQKNPYSSSGNCDDYEVCRADVNKDGKVDIFDLVMVISKFDEYSDEISNTKIKYKDADVNADGVVELQDLVLTVRDFGSEANEQKCEDNPLEHEEGNKYRVRVEGRGLYYVGVSYIATLF